MSRRELEEALRALDIERESLGDSERDRGERAKQQIELETQNRELREAQRLLDASCSRYADLFERAPVGYCTLDPEGIILEANLTFAALFRADQRAVQGAPLLVLFESASRRALLQLVRQCVVQKARVEAELSAMTKGHDTAAVLLHVVLVPVVSPTDVVTECRASLSDVTALRRPESALRFLADAGDVAALVRLEVPAVLRRSESALRFLADASDTLSSSLDRVSTVAALVRLAVPALADVCFVDLADGDQLRRVEVKMADPRKQAIADDLKSVADLPGGLEPQLQVLRSGEALRSSELGRLSEEGRMTAMFVPLTARGRTLGVLTLAVSESGRAYTARELELAKDIARRAGLAIDNARLYETAQEAIRAREDILAMVSHELRNPLGAIALSVQSLVRAAPADERRQSRKSHELIRRAAKRMETLVSDLLDASSLHAGHFTIQPQRHRALGLLEEAIEMCAPLAAEKSVTLASEPADGALEVVCDRERVLQVLTNLIGNAIKFTPSGGNIALRVDASAAGTRFAVEDTGPGIPKAQQKHLFDRYWQGHDARATGRRGRGLGLYIAKGIVEAHRGSMTVESSPGSGATFSFTLPAPAPLEARPGPGLASTTAPACTPVPEEPAVPGRG